MFPAIKIDKGIPLPVNGAGRPTIDYPFAKLGIGESFFVQNRKASSMYPHMRKAKPGRFLARPWKDGKITGVRVWRVS
jgi:hypothetical protein